MADAGDALTDFAGRLPGPLGQLAYFVGNHREAASLLAGTRRLDRRVQGQQVGLAGDLGNQVDNRSDFPRTFAQPLRASGRRIHRRRQLLQAAGQRRHPAGRGLRLGSGTLGHRRRALGAVAGHAQADRQLFQGGR